MSIYTGSLTPRTCLGAADIKFYWCSACILYTGVFGIVYDGFLSNAAEEVEGATPVIIKTVKGMEISCMCVCWDVMLCKMCSSNL